LGRRKHPKRTPKPQWQIEVDRDMHQYLVWERVIKRQENLIATHRLSGLRTTPVYELREGSPGKQDNPIEKILIDIDFAERKIQEGKQYQADLEEIVREVAAGDTDKETFIRRYWWTSPYRPIRARISYVLEALPFLAYREHGTGRITGPTRNFYVWRDEIYERLGEMLGRKEVR
jgi:hypothetical protein